MTSHLLGLRNEEQLLNSRFYGGLLENLLYMELRKQATWAHEEPALYYFRDNQKNEVDIILERGNANIIGIEVKASASVKSDDFKGLRILAEFAGDKFEKGILFYTGQEILPFHGENLNFYALPVSLLFNA